MERLVAIGKDMVMHLHGGVFKRLAFLIQGKIQLLLAQSLSGGGVTRYVLVLAGILVTALAHVLMKKSSGANRAHLN